VLKDVQMKITPLELQVWKWEGRRRRWSS